MLCGKAASLRLLEISSEALARRKLSGRVSTRNAQDETCKIIVRRFWTQKRVVNNSEFDKALNEIGNALELTCQCQTHFIPCHLTWALEPDEISIGPVIFRTRSSFRKAIQSRLSGYAVKNGADAKRKRKMLARVLRYYRQFRWVAEVTVRGCDKETSRLISERAVTSALDCFQLALGAQWTQKMAVEGIPGMWQRRGQLRLNSSGELSVSTSTSALGQVAFGKGWSSTLQDEELKLILHLSGVAIEAIVDPTKVMPLALRFLDAAQWFGEAVREKSASTSVIKFATALERMLMTDEKEDITSVLAGRLSALCFRPTIPGDREHWRIKTRQLYTLRSKLVHGSLSPSDKQLMAVAPLGAELAEHALLNFLTQWGEESLRAPKMGTKELSASFRGLVEWADAVEGRVQQRELSKLHKAMRRLMEAVRARST